MSQHKGRAGRRDRRRLVPALLGVLAGCAAAALAVVLGSSAVAQPVSAETHAVFDATHLPPLLTLSGERPRLTYDVHCAPEGVDDPEHGCDVDGTLFFRAGSRGEFRTQTLEPSAATGMRQLAAALPSDIATSADGFEYYAEFRAAGRPEPLVLPSGGADAPHRSLPLVS